VFKPRSTGFLDELFDVDDGIRMKKVLASTINARMEEGFIKIYALGSMCARLWSF